MQLICDALGVLGSRHGLLFNPIAKRCEIVRFDVFTEMPRLALRAGAVIAGRKCLLPLCPEGGTFDFHDQRLSPCTMAIIGICAAAAVKIKLTAVTPFRPRDAAFSTTPVIGLRLEAARITDRFRWRRKEIEAKEVELFIEFAGDAVAVTASGNDALDLRFTSVRREGSATETGAPLRRENMAQCDRVIALTGKRVGRRFTRTVRLDDQAGPTLDLAWCAHSGPVLAIRGERQPFKYAQQFPDLAAVAAWARGNPRALFDNAARVDGIVARNNCAKSVNNLLAYSLHSWLVNTWWVERAGKDWFSVWEGSCYYHSTVDVEYSQAPFYLAVWPELLGYQLDMWPEFAKDGKLSLGARGQGTLFLSHDVGRYAAAAGQAYTHEMEVEEIANYIVMAYGFYRRTGNDALLRAHGATIAGCLAFLAAADTAGTGVPDRGVANTLDDASPAIQFGRSQVYLAVKTLAAFKAGAEILELLGRADRARACRQRAARVRALIRKKGWRKDHFAVLMDKRGRELVDPETRRKVSVAELPGWDAAHIYTANGLAVLDMVGLDLGLDRRKICRDLRTAAAKCLREYGCVHTDFDPRQLAKLESLRGLPRAARNPGWISSNMLRDLAAYRRGIDLRALTDRYWEWQTTANTQEAKLFYESFCGNDSCFYPRGVAIWGCFEALAGLVLDAVGGIDRAAGPLAQVRVPRLFDAAWRTGACRTIST